MPSYKQIAYVGLSDLENDLREKEEEIRSLRKEVTCLKNQREMLIIDLNKPASLKPSSPHNAGSATTYLGKSTGPRDELTDEGHLGYPRKPVTVDDVRLGDGRPRKRMVDADGKVKELISADAKQSYFFYGV